MDIYYKGGNTQRVGDRAFGSVRTWEGTVIIALETQAGAKGLVELTKQEVNMILAASRRPKAVVRAEWFNRFSPGMKPHDL